MMCGASEAVWSLQCLLRWKVFLHRRGSADLATDPDLQDRLVSALFMAPSGATSCWRSHEDAISTHNKTEFYLWSKTISGKLSLLPFSQAHTDILIDCILCLRWSSWTPKHSTFCRTWHGPGIKPAAELQWENWHRRANFCSSRARLIFILSPLKVKEWNKGVNCPVAEGQTDLLFHPGFLSGRLNRDSSHSAAWISRWDCLPCGLNEPQWQQDANERD